MGDLISRKTLLEEIKGLVWADIATEYINKQPTAFDLESVIGQLEHLMNNAEELMNHEKDHLCTGNYPCEYNAADLEEARYKALCETIEILNSAANTTNGKIGV